MSLVDIVAQQQRWSRTRWAGHSGARAPSLAENLICPMTDEFRAQFAAGAGDELGRDEKPGKMQSLRSSSALAFNVLAPWHRQDLRPLAKALGHELKDREVSFERKYPHGLASAPPHLDVVLDAGQSRPLAIESKFTEPYGTKKPEAALSGAYFAAQRKRWYELGMPRCQLLAESVGRTLLFERLGAGQLLKHLLGLARSTNQRPRLHCLWFDAGCSEARVHRAELERFADAVDGEVEFSHQTYQELFAALLAVPEPIAGYAAYLRSRYALA